MNVERKKRQPCVREPSPDTPQRFLSTTQIATAITAEADVFITNDTDLKRVEEIEVLILNELAALRKKESGMPNRQL